jgi:hypothetical protein
LANQLSQPGKVVAMQEINDVINFADSMFVFAFLVLWCGFSLVVSWKISARLHNQLDELSREVRQQQLKLEEARRIFTQLTSSSGSRMHQEDASSIIPPEGLRI